jgi:sugar lactone lactonase YvrE
MLDGCLNYVSNGIALDSKGRAWIVTLHRQPTREEMGSVIAAPGARRIEIAAELEKIDAYKLEIFDPDGILLGEIRLDHCVHGMRIYKNYLFIWERNFAKYYQYEIIEK